MLITVAAGGRNFRNSDTSGLLQNLKGVLHPLPVTTPSTIRRAEPPSVPSAPTSNSAESPPATRQLVSVPSSLTSATARPQE